MLNRPHGRLYLLHFALTTSTKVPLHLTKNETVALPMIHGYALLLTHVIAKHLTNISLH